MSEKKLFLLDGMALVYRAYFAFSQNPRITSTGFNTSAIFGYTNTILDILKKEKPTHIGVSFDTSAPTARHIEYEAYKAHREEMPEGISSALPFIMKVTEALNIPILVLDGYEADDIIGTLAKKAEQAGFTTYMMTPDKDFGQLVSENIFIYKPARLGNDYEIMGVPEVLKRWEITDVKQVIDILGMWGDAVDNIPGIPGIGEKTAKVLVQKYGSMEGLYEHVHELKGKQKENVENNKEKAFLSKRLATIDLNVPIEFDEKALILDPPNKEACEALFTELEFKTMAKRLFGDVQQASTASNIVPDKKQAAASTAFDLFNPAPQTTVQVKEEIIIENDGESENVIEEGEGTSITRNNIENTPHNYVLVDSAEKQNELLQLLLKATEVCFDTETSSLETLDADIVGLSFSIKGSEAYYIPFPENYEEAKAILHIFKPLFESEQIVKIGQNIKYDLGILKQYGLTLKGPLFDTMLAHYLIEPDLRHGMDYLAGIYLNYEPVSITTLIGKKGKNQLNMRDVALEKIKEYAAEDADITFQLKEKLEPQLITGNLKPLFDEIEIPLIHVLSEVEREGIKIDKEFLNAYSVALQTDITLLEKRIIELAGMDFNIASPKQLGEVLFEHLALDAKAKKTKTI